MTDGGGGSVTYTYAQNDVTTSLGPKPAGENLKQVQTEYDGLGRVSKVCHIGSTTSTGSSTACNQNTGSANGATDAYTYTQGSGYTEVQVQRGGSGGQQRTNYYDALGRLSKKITPEGGTTTYFWDAAPAPCYPPNGYPTPGDLGAKLDNAGVYICYGYDSLHRLTGWGGSTCGNLVYDTPQGTLPAGITISNGAGRLIEAYTTSTCSGKSGLLTDEYFSYDKDGRMTDMWEMTPHSGQYYHSIAQFAGNGMVTSLQLASPSLYTITYGLDGEGRWNTLTDGSTNIVTGPLNGMYDAAGHVLNVQLTGSTPDQDIYTYDANTGRMKTFEFEVGTANLTGTLTWNTNGTLGELQIVDGFNSGGSETCYSNSSSALGYGYDDWARLVEFDCGSGNWGQQFSFDINDNLTKTVISGRTGTTWNPGYSSSTNQVNGATYDSNGNMTNDGGSNVYGWNEYGKMKWTASSGTPTCGSSGKCVTYDAFGRMVETSNGNVWTELWYTQVPGSRVSMNGTTENYAYWPSPGRGVFVDGGTKMFMHQDWLGNDRVVSSTGNHTVTADRAYAPYGEQYNTFGSTNPIYGMFAGITGDYDSGVLFDTPNRELSSVGRWVSPDPAGFGWNQYAYVTNPNSETDRAGLYCDLQQAAEGCGRENGFNEWGSEAGDQTDGWNSSVISSWDGWQVNSGWVGAWQSTSVGASMSPGSVGSTGGTVGADGAGSSSVGLDGDVSASGGAAITGVSGTVTPCQDANCVGVTATVLDPAQAPSLFMLFVGYAGSVARNGGQANYWTYVVVNSSKSIVPNAITAETVIDLFNSLPPSQVGPYGGTSTIDGWTYDQMGQDNIPAGENGANWSLQFWSVTAVPYSWVDGPITLQEISVQNGQLVQAEPTIIYASGPFTNPVPYRPQGPTPPP